MGKLSASEIATMKHANEAHMNDTAVIVVRSETLDTYGQPVVTWTDAVTIPIGLEFSPFKFRAREINAAPGEEVSEILVRARVSKDYYDSIKPKDRLRVTHRFGQLLFNPETYDVQGFEELGPSAMIVNLRRLEL